MKLFVHRIGVVTTSASFEGWLKRAFPDGWFTDDSGNTYWGTRASGILFVRKHPQEGWQMLMTLRSEAVDEGGTWGITGGSIPDDDMDPFESAMKETIEEIGSFPRQYNVINQNTWQAPGGTFTYTTFIVEVLDPNWGEFNFNWEVDDAEWMSLDNAHQLPLHPGVSDMLGSMGTKIFGDADDQDELAREMGEEQIPRSPDL